MDVLVNDTTCAMSKTLRHVDGTQALFLGTLDRRVPHYLTVDFPKFLGLRDCEAVGVCLEVWVAFKHDRPREQADIVEGEVDKGTE